MNTNGHPNGIPRQGELPLPPARGPAKGFKRSPEWRRARVLETLARFKRPRSIFYIRSHMPRPAVGPIGIEAALVELERRGRVRRRTIVVQGVERDGWELVRDEAPARAPEPERPENGPNRRAVADLLARHPLRFKFDLAGIRGLDETALGLLLDDMRRSLGIVAALPAGRRITGRLIAAIDALGHVADALDDLRDGSGVTLEDAVRWWMGTSGVFAAKASDDLFALAAVLAREAEKGGGS